MPVINLIATKATRIENTSATTNFSSQANIQVGEWNGGSAIDRSLVQFDLSSVPAGITVATAKLKLYDDGTDLTDNARVMSVYRVLRNWVEAQATWNIFSTGNNWGTAGCGNTTTDREATDIGTLSFPNPPSAGYSSITLTNASIQTMLAGSFTNNGFLLQMATESNDMHQFSDQTVSGQEPLLEITYNSGSHAYFM